MKTMTIHTNMALKRLTVCGAAFAFALGFTNAPAFAQTAPAPAQTQAPAEQALSEAQLEQLVAPIALYPDPLLSQVLMASTYPLEVVEAARWSHDNAGVKGSALQTAMQARSWDPSVKALAAVPQTLQLMSDKIDWTEQLGDAFLAQQQDVMNAVQNLRAQAQAAGNLQSTPQQRVTTAPAPQGTVSASMRPPIVIEPVDPDVYYVPVYNPAVAYGPWAYPAYPPFYWSPPGFVASNIVSFAAGVAVGAAIWGNCNWWNHNVFINVNNFNAFNHTNIVNNIWNHNPAHRGNVPYRNADLAQRFGGANSIANRDALRDRIDGERSSFERSNLSRFDGAGEAAQAATTEGLARRLPEGERPDMTRPDIAREAGRLEDRMTMPPRDSFRPEAERLEEMRPRAEEFRPSPRAFEGDAARMEEHFGGGRRRF